MTMVIAQWAARLPPAAAFQQQPDENWPAEMLGIRGQAARPAQPTQRPIIEHEQQRRHGDQHRFGHQPQTEQQCHEAIAGQRSLVLDIGRWVGWAGRAACRRIPESRQANFDLAAAGKAAAGGDRVGQSRSGHPCQSSPSDCHSLVGTISGAVVGQISIPILLSSRSGRVLSNSGGWLSLARVAGATVLLAAITTAAIAGGECPYLLVGWLWFVGMMFPVLGFGSVSNHAMADRYNVFAKHKPDACVCWARPGWPGILGGQALPGGSGRGDCRWAAGVPGISANFVLAARRFFDTMGTRVSITGNAKVENGLARSKLGSPRLDEAIESFHRAGAVGVDAQYSAASAACWGRQKKLDGAEIYFRKALRAGANFAARTESGPAGRITARSRTKRPHVIVMRAAMARNLPMPSFRLANLLLRQGRRDDTALEFAEPSLDDRHVVARLRLAAIETDRGRIDGAMAQSRAILRFSPDDSIPHQELDRLQALPRSTKP